MLRTPYRAVIRETERGDWEIRTFVPRCNIDGHDGPFRAGVYVRGACFLVMASCGWSDDTRDVRFRRRSRGTVCPRPRVSCGTGTSPEFARNGNVRSQHRVRGSAKCDGKHRAVSRDATQRQHLVTGGVR